MTRLEQLKERVRSLYAAKHEGRADWADWLYEHHVMVTADYAAQLARRYEANEELATAAALLHDVADAVMKREAPGHEEKSWETARALLTETGFNDTEIKIVVDDAIRFHSCHDGERPQTLEGKIVATADALSHLKTDFYRRAFQEMSKTKSPNAVTEWICSKIERDFHEKILFDEVREETRPDYEKLKASFLK
ncbi:MAG: HD domain-containing protein [bacterium]|nr:HD domain-containing protein [bacterium]MDZ4296556.1 HD domain-containing protein [Patescibacteria group bacterium]